MLETTKFTPQLSSQVAAMLLLCGDRSLWQIPRHHADSSSSYNDNLDVVNTLHHVVKTPNEENHSSIDLAHVGFHRIISLRNSSVNGSLAHPLKHDVADTPVPEHSQQLFLQKVWCCARFLENDQRQPTSQHCGQKRKPLCDWSEHPQDWWGQQGYEVIHKVSKPVIWSDYWTGEMSE